MTKEQKQILLKFIFPTDEIRNFLCNYFFQELLVIIPTSLCISKDNMVNKTREENAQIVKNKVIDFLKNNNNYVVELAKLYHNKDVMGRVDDFITGFVFYLTCVNDKFQNIDIFKDKKSICYTEISIVDIF